MTVAERVRALEQAIEDMARRINSLESAQIYREHARTWTLANVLSLGGIFTMIVIEIVKWKTGAP